MEISKPSISVDDLRAIYIKRQLPDEVWGVVDIHTATDAEFHSWIQSRISDLEQPLNPTKGWSLESRSRVCNQLWQTGRLTLIASMASPTIQEYVRGFGFAP